MLLNPLWGGCYNSTTMNENLAVPKTLTCRHLRCNGPLSNFGPFAAAFDLPDDAAIMRPVEDRVEIW